MKRILYISGLLALSVLAGGCKKFLEEKPSKDLAVPSTLKDLQALLDQSNVFNANYPNTAEMAADNYYVTTAVWQARSATERHTYIWEEEVFNDNEFNSWSTPYTVVYNSNVVLDELGKDAFKKADEAPRYNVRGQALFFRSMAFYELLQVFARPYGRSSGSQDPGIALRLHADLNEPSNRASVQRCYEQVVGDLEEAVRCLPEVVPLKTRPSRGAAYALLARVYLAMEEYAKAGAYADSALQLHPVLMDYNTLNAGAANPLPLFNAEVIFHSVCITSNIVNLSGKVDSILYGSYQANDLRKVLFFNAAMNFRGSYDGSVRMFNGLAADELYLIRAECRAREGRVAESLEDLNTLLVKRWKAGTFVPLSAGRADEALEIILRERRKELAFRGLRWTDLRRLNRDPRFARTLTRMVNQKTYTLTPSDNRYTFPLPEGVVRMTGMAQNPR